MKIRIVISFALIISSVINTKAQIKNGNELITAMYNTYNGKWYKNFTFTQDAIFYSEGKETRKEIWHEAASFPGKLVIKYDSMNSGNGVVFSNYTVVGIKNGIAKQPKPFIHDLLLVGFDLYFLPPETSIKILDSLGYNLKILREDYFEGRKCWVCGAEKNDSISNQFWIDQERLYMHNITYKKNQKTMNVVFTDYEKIKGNWVSKKVIFKKNGITELIEKYYNIKFPQNLDQSIFESKYFLDAKW